MHPCNVILHGFSYSAFLSQVQKEAQYEKSLNNGKATPVNKVD